MSSRRYTKQRRARQEAETRQRIVDAAVALHGVVGPRHTTISAIAQRAGVQRLTVYRHFPDQDALFRACTSHWLEDNPPPDPDGWATVADPAERTRAALGALYRYYRGTATMWRLTYRDLAEVTALQGPVTEFERYLERIRDDLERAWRGGESSCRDVALVLGHATRFETWQSLAHEGADDAAAADLAVAWVAALAHSSPVGRC